MTLKDLTALLMSDKPSEKIKKHEEEVFNMIPELEKCKGFNQNNEWHPYDVYEHTLHVVDNVENNKILRFAALFHDVGKPESYTEDEFGTGHFYGHWEVSKEVFESFIDKYDMDKKESELISKLILYHDINLGKIEDYSIDRFLKLFNKKELVLLYKLKRADLLAQNEKYHFLLDEYKKQEEVYKLLYERKNIE